MYPSNHTNCLLDQTMPYYDPSLSDQTPLSTLTTSSFLNSPSPYEDDLILQYLFHHQPLIIPEVSAPDSNKSEVHNNNDKFMKQNPRKRCYKKDRHSKIETAQGPRDRRMRLSLEVARRFFDLQDMLGFDKASKTVGWLLIKSNTAIEELKRQVKKSCSIGGNNYSAASSTTSECEVVSGIDESAAVDGNWHRIRKGKSSKTLGKGKKNFRRKSAFDPLLITRESREKARARARERTREKKMFDGSKLALEVSGTQHLDLLAHVEHPSSSIILNHNNGLSQENHFRDFQGYGKSWEAYNNIKLMQTIS